MANKKVIKINPYADPRTAAMNADWIKIARKNRLKREAEERLKREKDGGTDVAKEYKSFAAETNIIKKGGAGSGNFGHAWRRGKVGGSAKHGTHTTAGITPFHESKKLTIAEVDEKGRTLAAALKKISTVSNVSYDGVGSGGWEGGAEPTLIMSYDGNGEGIKLMAEFGQKWGQDGVLLRRRSNADDPAAQLSFVFHFDDILDKDERKVFEDLAVEYAKEEYGEANIGWTWWDKDGRTSFDSQSVSQWGGDAKKHERIFDKLRTHFTDGATATKEYNIVGIMDSDAYDTPNSYSKVIAGKNPFEVNNE